MADTYPPITVDMYFDARKLLTDVLPPQEDPYVTHVQDVAIHWTPIYANPPFQNPLRAEEEQPHVILHWTCLNPIVSDDAYAAYQHAQIQKE